MNNYSYFFSFFLLVLITSCTQSLTKQLLKNEVNPNAPKELNEFGQLVGEWDCTISNRTADNTWKEKKATWIFKYILDGYAVQDFWISPVDKTQRPEGKDMQGTNIRIYNPKQKKWLCSWIENQNYSVSAIWEANMNDKQELILHNGTGNWEIIFYNITANTFDWKWDFLQEDGKMKTMSKIKGIRKS